MSDKRMLPPLIENAPPIGNISPPGQWDRSRNPAGGLANIAQSLKVPKPEDGRDVFRAAAHIDAIPSPWARVLGYALALTDNRHPQHLKAVGAFRGFLALLAFRERQAKPVQVSRLNLNVAGDHFLPVLNTLQPPQVMVSDTRWDDVYVFYLQDVIEPQAIGLASPLTLVCPNEGTHLSLLYGLPWWTGNEFEDPKPRLSGEDRRDLAAWIQDLENNLRNHGAAEAGIHWSGNWSADLSGLLTEYRRDLLAGLNAGGVPPQRSRSSLRLNAVYQHLKWCLASVPLHSYVKVFDQRQRGGARDLLVVEKDLPKSIHDPGPPERVGMPEGEIRFTNALTYENVLAEIRAGAHLGHDRKCLGRIQLTPPAEWRTPEDFFTKKLLLIEGTSRAFPGARSIPGADQVEMNCTPLLPIRRELLDYLTPDHIHQTASYTHTGQGIEVRLTIPFPQGRSLQISKIYHDILRIRDLPVLEVWPGFRHPDWHCYYVFWGQRESTFQASPYGVVVEESGEGRDKKIWKLNQAPEFFACTLTERTPAGGTREEEVGILLCDLPQISPPARGRVKVGVDFGSTNSIFYMQKDGQAPQPFELRSAAFSITLSELPTRKRNLYSHFIPPDLSGDDFIEAAPFLSFFRDRPGHENVVLTPVIDGHILFYNDEGSRDEVEGGRVYHQLKWTQQSSFRVEAYLKQLCLHCAAEAFRQGASNLEFRYSIPTAFSVATRQQFGVMWSNIRSWVEGETGIHCDQDVSWLTESVAAARYFTAFAAPAVGAVFVDVGGGTSDIAFWKKRGNATRVLIQSSIRLSGKEMLLTPLYRLRCMILDSLLGGIGVDKKRIDALSRMNDQHQFFVWSDALLRTFGDEIEGQLRHPKNATEPLLVAIALGLSGILYYAGLMVRRSLQIDPSEGKDVPEIHVGGNGCRLFHWVSSGSFRPGSEINSLLKKAFRVSSGLDDDCTISLSRDPKHEAARGLVENTPLGTWNDNNDALFDEVVAGEPFSIDGTRRDTLDLLTREHLHSGIRVDGITSLKRCLELFNEAAGNPRGWILPAIPDPDALLERVRRDIVGWAAEQQMRALPSIILEPLFVVGLQKLLLRLPEHMAQRQTAGQEQE